MKLQDADGMNASSIKMQNGMFQPPTAVCHYFGHISVEVSSEKYWNINNHCGVHSLIDRVCRNDTN